MNAVDKSGTSDLYIWDVEKSILTRLTNDVYDDRDPDWSPSGDEIVFASDRSSFGEHGKYNLFVYHLRKHDITYLTYGADSYSAPRYSPDGRSTSRTRCRIARRRGSARAFRTAPSSMTIYKRILSKGATTRI